MRCVIRILRMSVKGNIPAAISPVLWLCFGTIALKYFLDSVTVVKINVYDDAFQLRILTK